MNDDRNTVSRTDKVWGFEDLLHQGNDYALKKLVIRSGHQTSKHFHRLKHETVVCFEGALGVRTFDSSGNFLEEIVLAPGEFRSISPLSVHQMFAANGEVTYFEAQSDHLDDVVRIS